MLLSANLNKLSDTPKAKSIKKEENLAITPNYIRSPPLGYKVSVMHSYVMLILIPTLFRWTPESRQLCRRKDQELRLLGRHLRGS